MELASSSKDKVMDAVKCLRADTASASVPGAISGDIVDGKDANSIKTFLDKAGEIDHLVWTSGDALNYVGQDLEAHRDVFDVRFWGAAITAKAAKLRKGVSVTITTGTVFLKPRPGEALGSAAGGAVDGFARGLAVDMAPILLNSVCSGAVKTELWNTHPPEAQQKLFVIFSKSSLVKHVAYPDEVVEAYIFLMKCKYIPEQRIKVDGGA